MAVTASVTAPTTKAPISVALGRLPMISLHSVFRAARQEAAHLEVRRVREEVPRRAVRDAGPRLRIEEDAVVPDREDARQLVRHDDDGRAEAVAKFEDEAIEEPGGYRAREALAAVEDLALGGLREADQVAEDGALPGAAAAHDDEDGAAPHGEVQVVQDDEVPVGDRRLRTVMCASPSAAMVRSRAR